MAAELDTLPSPWRVEQWDPGRRVALVKGWSVKQILAGLLWLLPFGAPIAVLAFPQLAARLGNESPEMSAAGLTLMAVFPGAIGVFWIVGARPRKSVVDWAAGSASDAKLTASLNEVAEVELRETVLGGDSDAVRGSDSPASYTYDILLKRNGAPAVELLHANISVFSHAESYDRLVPLAQKLSEALHVPCRLAEPPLRAPWERKT